MRFCGRLLACQKCCGRSRGQFPIAGWAVVAHVFFGGPDSPGTCQVSLELHAKCKQCKDYNFWGKLHRKHTDEREIRSGRSIQNLLKVGPNVHLINTAMERVHAGMNAENNRSKNVMALQNLIDFGVLMESRREQIRRGGTQVTRVTKAVTQGAGFNTRQKQSNSGRR